METLYMTADVMSEKETEINIKVPKNASGIDTIKHHTQPRAPHGKVTKTQVNITYKSVFFYWRA